MSSLEQVAEFHLTFNHPIATRPQIPDSATAAFRIAFMREELNGLEKAIKDGDIVEMADGFCDLQYVLNGFILNAGMQDYMDDMNDEVHRSNMSKACTDIDDAVATANEHAETWGDIDIEEIGEYFVVKRQGDGKVVKAITYSKPDLKSILELP